MGAERLAEVEQEWGDGELVQLAGVEQELVRLAGVKQELGEWGDGELEQLAGVEQGLEQWADREQGLDQWEINPPQTRCQLYHYTYVAGHSSKQH